MTSKLVCANADCDNVLANDDLAVECLHDGKWERLPICSIVCFTQFRHDHGYHGPTYQTFKQPTPPQDE